MRDFVIDSTAGLGRKTTLRKEILLDDHNLVDGNW